MLHTRPVTDINGIGEKTAAALHQLGIASIADLLDYFPYRYDDYEVVDLSTAAHEERVTIEGKVHSEPSLRHFGKKKSRLTVRVMANRVLATAVIFNRPYLYRQLKPGDDVTVTGKWDRFRAQLTVQEIQRGFSDNNRNLEPVYSVNGEISVKQMRKWIADAFKTYGEEINEPLTPEMLSQYKLIPKRQAVRILHFPESREVLKHARRRMVYEELLLFQLKMQAYKAKKQAKENKIPLPINMEEVASFIKGLPFRLTAAQEKVTREILGDIRSSHYMNRLLQGDVGSGKTVVAAIALFAVVTADAQGALMVPTEILAEQHAESMNELLASFGIRIGLLTGSVKGKRRKELLRALEAGDIDVLIGTHALIQDEVLYNKLGLVITDEQHRFGVMQRRRLRAKGENPDVLYMTATPIPRTLAISAYGDMDVSTIDQMPGGRKPIKTFWGAESQLDQMLGFVKKEIMNGRQAYVICPLIEESEQLDVQNAVDVHNYLQEFFPSLPIGLVHGRMPNQEKEEVMQAFKNNEIKMLVSTTVVEVGVNVPNATVMIIYDAQRFGLAQLHQLRGRVGRGDEQSYCLLIADAKSEESQERMRMMTETTDGFELSEFDLQLRGPGDFFGKKQSGAPEFKVADLVHDFKALTIAREDAVKLAGSKAFWEDEKYSALRLALSGTGIFEQEHLD